MSNLEFWMFVINVIKFEYNIMSKRCYHTFLHIVFIYIYNNVLIIQVENIIRNIFSSLNLSKLY